MLFILRRSIWSTLIHHSGQHVVVHPMSQMSYRLLDRTCVMIVASSTSLRRPVFVPGPISVIVVQVSLPDQLLPKRVALLCCLPRILGLLYSL